MTILSLVEKREVQSEISNLGYKVMYQEQKRIMLLSNTEDLGRIIQLSLQEIAGWQVFMANLSFESLTIVETIKPDIILLDTILPDLDGLTMLRMIQAHQSLQNIPILLLTERMLAKDRQLYKKLGVVSAIAKPFDLVNLAAEIATKLNWDLNKF